MATRHRGYSLPVRLASTFSQAKVTFLDEISYTKLTDDNDVIKKEDDKEDKPFRKQSDSKSVTFSILSNDKLDNETEPNNDMPAEEPRQRRTSRHWSSSCSRHRNASSLSVLSNPSSVATDDSGIRSAATFKLTVLKIIFVNILFSLINKAFDFSQVKLFSGFKGVVLAMLVWSHMFLLTGLRPHVWWYWGLCCVRMECGRFNRPLGREVSWNNFFFYTWISVFVTQFICQGSIWAAPTGAELVPSNHSHQPSIGVSQVSLHILFTLYVVVLLRNHR